ncbi:hypothetical protein [Dictyobacter kobayashii]|uniref:Uncharacterized protein n=1 Tax=Dictyobacter kobayashii TaxID=2014872 RepID=A0A402AFL8_9CHLR|nr:hypothetical protein [Dictyobacter kobayashii]GCE17901.1 hypothetical protein KDK_17010 [Dictyobacter kobayashii]
MSIDPLSDTQKTSDTMFEIDAPVELARVSEEIKSYTKMMGNDLLAGFPNPKDIQVVLNLPCGPGD